jgi:hypothetical protein
MWYVCAVPLYPWTTLALAFGACLGLSRRGAAEPRSTVITADNRRSRVCKYGSAHHIDTRTRTAATRVYARHQLRRPTIKHPHPASRPEQGRQ